MTSILCFFSAAAVKVESHFDIEFSVACFLDLEGRSFDCAGRVGVGHVQFELDFFEPGVEGGTAVEGFYVDAPAFCVAFWDWSGGCCGGVEVPGL